MFVGNLGYCVDINFEISKVSIQKIRYSLFCPERGKTITLYIIGERS